MHILRGHTGPVRCLAYSPDGSELASGGEDGFLLIWDVANGKERLARQDVRSALRGLAYSPDGRWLASASASVLVGGDRAVILRDATDARPLKRHEPTPTGRDAHDSPIRGLAFAAGGRFLVSAGGNLPSTRDRPY